VKVTTLDGYSIALEKSTEPTEGQNGVGIEDVWTLIFTDQRFGEQYRISFRKDTRDKLIERLTGVIVV
jgi:hypothetical protein